jgi:hypothetical protein
MSHLTPDELVDAVEQTLAVERQAHLTGCDHCLREVTELTAVLRGVRAVEVSEPSPLFWDHFSSRVRRAIAAEPAIPPRLARWFQWPVLAPLTGLALLVVALIWAVPDGASGLLEAQLALRHAVAEPAPEPTTAAESWDIVAALIGDVDFDTVSEAGIPTTPGAADDAVLLLSSAEQMELARLLREELERSGG